MPKFLFKKNTIVHSLNGANCISFKANVARDVPPKFAAPVLIAGGVESIDVPVEAPTPEIVNDPDAVAQVMIDIILEDDPALLTTSKGPRVQEVDRRLGRATSKQERDAAWALVEV
jgi:hypothetical protein